MAIAACAHHLALRPILALAENQGEVEEIQARFQEDRLG